MQKETSRIDISKEVRVMELDEQVEYLSVKVITTLVDRFSVLQETNYRNINSLKYLVLLFDFLNICIES